MLEASNQDGTEAARPQRRRITADSFRALQARLAGVPFVPRQEPVIDEVAPVVAMPRFDQATIELPPPPASFAQPHSRIDWVPPQPPATANGQSYPESAGFRLPPDPVPDEPVAIPVQAEAAVLEEEPAPQPWPAPEQADTPEWRSSEAEPQIDDLAPREEPVPQGNWSVEIPSLKEIEELAGAATPEVVASDASAVEPPSPEWPQIEKQAPEAPAEPAPVVAEDEAVFTVEVAPEPRETVGIAEPAIAATAAAPEPVRELEVISAEVPAAPVPVQPKSRDTSLLRRTKAADDPFAGAIDFNAKPAEPEVPAVVIEDPDAQAGDVARSLIDIMASSAGSSQPQERALAADTLLRLVPRVPVKDLVQIAERVAKMDNPPQLLVSRIIRDPRPEVAATLLERAGNIADQELLSIAAENDPLRLRMIARRRTVSTALSDAIVKSGDTSALLTLVRNPGASLSHDAFQALCEMARGTQALHAPLATRADTPPVVAFQMFWLLPAELRRYVLSRFLTDSETLNRILKITMAVDGGEDPTEAGEAKFPSAEDVDSFVAYAAMGDIESAARRLAEFSGVCEETGRRILSDAEGEPLTVLFKSLGLNRTRFGEALERLSQPPASLIRSGRNLSDLQGIFDQLSFNKARVLLTYWDWAAQQTGPYAKRAA
jgi:hypothetical protein